MHNDPSGDPTLSRADIQMTQAIVAVARPLGIAVHDHIIDCKGRPREFEGAAVDLGRLRRFSHEVEILREAFRS